MPDSTIEDFCAKALEQLHKTLVERGASYGSFFDNSKVAVSILENIQGGDRKRRNELHDKMCQQNGLETPTSLVYVVLNAQAQIASKLSRLSQTPLHLDSWLDLAGYAILAHAAIAMQQPQVAKPAPVGSIMEVTKDQLDRMLRNGV